MSFPASSQLQNQSATSTPDPQGQASAALKLGQTGSLLSSFPGGNTGSAFGPGSPFASTFQLSPGEDFFRQFQLGQSMPGATLNQALGYTGAGGRLGNLFTLNPASQQLYNQGVQGYSLLTDPTQGLFQNYLNRVVGPIATNNAIKAGYGGASGATLQALTNAGSNAAMQYASLYPSLVSSGLGFAQAPQSLAAQGLTSLGLPLALQDYQNLGTGFNAAGTPRTLSQQFGLNQQAQLNALLAGLPFPVGVANTGAGQLTNQQSVLGSILAPMASMGLLGLGNSGSLGRGLGSLGSSIANLFGGGGESMAPSAVGAATDLIGGIPTALSGVGNAFQAAAPEGDIVSSLLGSGLFSL